MKAAFAYRRIVLPFMNQIAGSEGKTSHITLLLSMCLAKISEESSAPSGSREIEIAIFECD